MIIKIKPLQNTTLNDLRMFATREDMILNDLIRGIWRGWKGEDI
jgi:hypothetical protein